MIFQDYFHEEFFQNTQAGYPLSRELTNNLIEKFTNDLTSNNTFFYPCSGQDINTIIKLLDFNENILDINNFILVDLNMNYDHETNDLEMTGYYGLEREEFFFDNYDTFWNYTTSDTDYLEGLGSFEINSKK